MNVTLSGHIAPWGASRFVLDWLRYRHLEVSKLPKAHGELCDWGGGGRDWGAIGVAGCATPGLAGLLEASVQAHGVTAPPSERWPAHR